MQKIFISSIPGTRLTETREVLEELGIEYGHKCASIDLEVHLKQSYASLFPLSEEASGIQPIYNEPRDLVQEAVSNSVDEVQKRLVQFEAEGVKSAFLFFHSVFSNPITLQSYAPYKASDLIRLCGGVPPRFLTLVDDVYDIHSTLANSRYFTRLENDWRNPKLDFHHLHRLLEWRKADAVVCQHLANELGVSHKLVHQKSPATVFWRIAVEDAPTVYLSHSISQARRNWNGVTSGKCPEPSARWAEDFSDEVNDVGRKLDEAGFAVQEPTCVDEYRVDKEATSNLTLSDLKSGLLPPKNKAWPLRKTKRLIERDDDVTGVGLTCVDPEILEKTFIIAPGNEAWTKDMEQELQEMAPRMLALAAHFEDEVLRQITARDYTLTSQCRAVIVYRPFSNPYVPEVSGGVKDEMECRLTLSEARSDLNLSLFVLHPFSDEKKRRMNLLHGWKGDGGEFERLWATHCEGSPPKGFIKDLDTLVDNAAFLVKGNDVKTKMRALAAKHSVRFIAKKSESSMSGDPVSLAKATGEAFIAELAEKLFDDVELFQTMAMDNPIIKIYDSKEISSELISDLKKSLEKLGTNGSN